MKNKTLFFILILLFGLGIRLIGFPSNPPSLYWDEVAIGLDARSLINTGKDMNGESWLQPLFKSYGDYKAPIYIYLVTLIGQFLPIDQLAIRLPSLLAFIGILAIWYQLIKELTKKTSLALLTSLSLVIMPWSIHFSKIGFESHLSVFWLSLSLLLLIKGQLRRKNILIVLSGLALSFGIYTYIVLRVIGPIIFISTYLIFSFPKFKKTIKPFLLSLAIILFSTLTLTSSSDYKLSQNYRLSNDNLVTSDQHIIDSVNAREASSNNLLSRIVYHRYTYKAKAYLQNYLTYFSPDFLLFKGDPNLRHHSGYGGMILISQAVFLIFGLFNINKLKLRSILFFSTLLLVSPSIAALVNETPHASRSIYLILPLSLLIGLGLNSLTSFKKINLKLLAIVVTVVLGFNLSLYLNDYQEYYPQRSHLVWITPYQKTFEFINDKDVTQPIYITDQLYQPNLYAKFYLKKDLSIFFSLPENCPQNALCITTPEWQTEDTTIYQEIPGTKDLVIKQFNQD